MECQEVVDNRRRKMKICRRTGKMEDFIEYKEARAKAVKVIKQKKRESYQRFVEGINKYQA